MRMLIRAVVALVVLLALASPVAAQAPPTSYELQIFSPGVNPATGAPISSSPIPLSATTCNLATPPTPTGSVVGPRFIYWDDPAIVNRSCRVDRFTVFLALPIANNYLATMTASNATGASGRSAASNPFSVALLPAAVPTGLVVIQ